MKFNKWTLGLAALGAVSLASAARADETAPLSPVNTAVSGTTLSGVVDVSAQQSFGHLFKDSLPAGSLPHGSPIGSYYGVGKNVDGFSLDQVLISLDKALEADKPWSAGYHIDLNYGDAAIMGYSSGHHGSSSAGIRQAYVALNTPFGNGIDWKVGVFDGVTGYEGNTLSGNPNFTRSFGWQVNPSSFTGIIGSYKFTDMVSVQAGVANRANTWAMLGQSSAKTQSKDYIATVTFTAPESFGFLKGSTFNLQTVQGFDNQSVANYHADATLATPVAGLKFGLSYDAVNNVSDGFLANVDAQIFGVFGTYQATDKLGFALRGETAKLDVFETVDEVTATVSYNLWANVLSRLEVRWDHIEHGTAFGAGSGGIGGYGNYSNALLFAANIAYKF